MRSIRLCSVIMRWQILQIRQLSITGKVTTNKEKPEMTKGIRKSHDREPSARKTITDEFEHLRLTQDSRRKINDLHPRAKRKLLVRLHELFNSFSQWSASFSIPSYRISTAKTRIHVDAEIDPSTRSLSLNLQ